jgi:hypothetical protein
MREAKAPEVKEELHPLRLCSIKGNTEEVTAIAASPGWYRLKIQEISYGIRWPIFCGC